MKVHLILVLAFFYPSSQWAHHCDFSVPRGRCFLHTSISFGQSHPIWVRTTYVCVCVCLSVRWKMIFTLLLNICQNSCYYFVCSFASMPCATHMKCNLERVDMCSVSACRNDDVNVTWYYTFFQAQTRSIHAEQNINWFYNSALGQMEHLSAIFFLVFNSFFWTGQNDEAGEDDDDDDNNNRRSSLPPCSSHT